MSGHFVYIVECADGTLYSGSTTDLKRRVIEHNSSPRGARYTRSRRPVVLRYYEEHESLGAARKREYALQSLSRSHKLQLVRDTVIGSKKILSMKTAKAKTTFTGAVYATAARIPVGKVMTYGGLAKAAGNPRAARAVGMLMRTNPDRKTVPCHRVVSSTGALTGYAFGKGISTKKQLLKKEGVAFKGDRVDLSLSEWKASARKK